MGWAEIGAAVGRFNGYGLWVITKSPKIMQYADHIRRDYEEAKRLLFTLPEGSKQFDTMEKVVIGYEKTFNSSVLGI